MKNYGDIDSKFRYVIIASLRAKDLLKGAKPRIKTRSKNLIRVAQKEVKEGLIDYELINLPSEEVREVENDIFIGEEIREPDKEPEAEGEAEGVKKEEEEKPGTKPKSKTKPKEETKSKPSKKTETKKKEPESTGKKKKTASKK